MEELIANALSMKQVNAAPSSDNPIPKTSKISTYLNRFGLASMALLTAGQLAAEPLKKAQSSKTSSTQITFFETDSLERFRKRVAQMSEKELRATSKALAAKIQPMMDAEASDEELLPYLEKYEVVHIRLDPIIKGNRKKLQQTITRQEKDIAEINFASDVFVDVRKKLEKPENVDWDETLKNLQIALAYHKKHNPHLYRDSDTQWGEITALSE